MIPNILSAIRLIMAVGLLVKPSLLTIPYVLIGGGTDFLDGYLARRWKLQSKLGVWLDPLADKLFAGVVVFLLYSNSVLSPWQVAALFSRDIALVMFSIQLLIFGMLNKWTVQSFLFGKWATAFQFLIFLLLIGGVSIPDFVYWGMGALGPLCLIELILLLQRKAR